MKSLDFLSVDTVIANAADRASPIVEVSTGVQDDTARILRDNRALEDGGLLKWVQYLRDWRPIIKRDPARERDVGPAYASAALTGMVSDIGGAVEGLRNRTVFLAALRAGRMIASGWIDEQTVSDTLVDAAVATGLHPLEARAAVKSGIRNGLKHGPMEINQKEQT